MKRIITSFLSIILVLSFNVAGLANSKITVKLDGETLNFDVQPQLIGGRTMVPLRVIFESLGAVVEWDNETSTVTAYNEFYLVKATIGSNTMLVNGIEKQIDIPPMIVDARTLVPVRFVAEAFNCDVQWDGNTQTVFITSGNNDYSKVEQSIQHQDSNVTVNYYNETKVPTYTSITGCPLKYNIPTSEGEMIYTYSYNRNEVNSYADYLTYHNWWQTNRDNDANGLFLIYQNNEFHEKLCIAVDEETNEVQIIRLTKIADDTDNSNNDISSQQYYSGSNVPTYTSITGYDIYDTTIAEDNTIIYLYTYDKNAVNKYLATLSNLGWEKTYADSTVNEHGNIQYIYTNYVYKEKAHILISYENNLVAVMAETDLIESYPGTNIPTYTAITGEKLLDVFYADNGVAIYSYVEDYDSLGDYMYFLQNNGWNVELGDAEDYSYSEIKVTSREKNKESFIITVEYARSEICVYVRY